MRLIDAQHFINRFTSLCETDTDIVIAKVVCGALIDEPTAYDIDKVISELEKLADESYKAYCIAFNSDDRAEYDAYTNAIEIVKQGGVADDVCEWDCDEYGRWHTKCHYLADNDPLEYTYCPYCGKKLK